MPADHSSIVSFTTILSPNPPTRAGFGKLLIIVAKATNSLNSETTREYASAIDAAADLTAGYISQATHDRVAVCFQQTPRPSGVRVGNVDLVAPETYSAAFTRIKAVTNDFYAVLTDSRDGAIIAAVAATVETDGTKQYFAQDEDSSWLDSGVPAAFSGIVAYNRTNILWHDTNTEYAAEAWVASRVAFDPDEQSCDWKASLVGVDGLATGLTTAQRGFIVTTNKINVGLPFGSADNFVYPGQNISGRSTYEILSADWFRARVQEDIGDLYVRMAAKGDKIVVGPEGQTQVLAILEARLSQGVAAKHFLRGQTRATALAITQGDLDAKQMRFTAEAQVAQSANVLSFTFYLQNEPLAAA